LFFSGAPVNQSYNHDIGMHLPLSADCGGSAPLKNKKND